MLCEDAHANAEEICRSCDAFAAQNLSKRNSNLYGGIYLWQYYKRRI